MDRTDAIRLLEALVVAGMTTRAPRANAWIEKKALQIGLEGIVYYKRNYGHSEPNKELKIPVFRTQALLFP